MVRSIADQVGIEAAAARGAATPEDKLEAVREAATDATVAMVGDGVNDAAALAAATVGIGVHGGAEAALAAADVYLGRPGLEPVVDLLRGSRRTLGVIRRNLVFSLTYNVVAVSFAITGHMSPAPGRHPDAAEQHDRRSEFVSCEDVLNRECKSYE